MNTKPSTSPGFLESEIGRPNPEESLFHVIPVPLEHTVSYGGGTGQGPEAILIASQQLEVLDAGTVPAQAGIFTHAAIDCSTDTPQVLGELERLVTAAINLGKVPVVLGGEHTVSLGAVRGIRTGKETFGVVHVDAHADLRDQYEGTPYSHACVMRRIVEEGVPVFQLGVRSMSPDEVAFRSAKAIGHLDADEIFRMERTGAMLSNILPGDFPKNIYLTIDVDGFDPSVIPATGTPEPGGLGWWQGLDLIERAVAGRRIVGFDVVELAPEPGLHYADYTVARLVYRVMGISVRSGDTGSAKK